VKPAWLAGGSSGGGPCCDAHDTSPRWRRSTATLLAPPGAAAAPLLDFSDASHGWLVFGGVTWRTSDGGINWT
jgi:hypothetical protein